VSWPPVEASSAADAVDRHGDPLRALADGDIPAVILRAVYPVDDCLGLVGRFIDRGLMRDPHVASGPQDRTRIDIGTSLGNRGNDQPAFFQHAAETHELFTNLFEGFQDPVACIYDDLQTLAGSKRVITACEPDGRRYGPAIFRVHYDGHAYPPHIDHVILREKRFDYAVTRFPNQFAGILCMENAASTATTQAILHQCMWSEQVQPHLADRTYPEYAARHGLGQCRVELEPGDLYFFNTGHVHEVPAVVGDSPRIVLAVFIGYAPEDPEVFVWS
jgi:hypothetical protein